MLNECFKFSFDNFIEKQENNEKFLVYLFPIKTKLQQGPTCGMLAILLSIGLFLPDTEITLQKLLDLAFDLKISLKGELFSVFYFENLVNSTLLIKADVLKFLDSSSLISLLNNQKIVAICYNKDKNHEPCCDRNNPHWCLIIGYVEQDNSLSEKLNFKSLENFIAPVKKNYEQTPQNLNLVCIHGKSLRYFIWKYSDLIKSNQSLYHYPPNPGFVIPDDGDMKQLRNYFVVLSKN